MQPRYFLYISIYLFLLGWGCRQRPAELDFFSEATRVKIFEHRQNDGRMTDTLVFETPYRAEIDKILGFVSTRSTEAFKCGSTGMMVFEFTNKPRAIMEFNLKPECQHVAYTIDNQIFFKELAPEGQTYLKKLIH